MHFTDLFKITKTCKHEHVTPDKDCAYCPDCGQLIKNEWYITRCACCGVKLKTMTKNGQVIPQHRYCANCGSEDFRVEKLEQINFIDINFAALMRVVVEEKNSFCATTRCWQEKTDVKPKLLVQYL